jgi:hypothetical protein
MYVRDQTWYNVETLDSVNLGNQQHLRQLLCIHGFKQADINPSYIYQPILMKASVVPMYVKTTDVEIMDTSMKTRNSELKSGVFAFQLCPLSCIILVHNCIHALKYRLET